MIELASVVVSSFAGGWIVGRILRGVFGVIKTVAFIAATPIVIGWMLGIVSINYAVLAKYIEMITMWAMGKVNEFTTTVTLSATSLSFIMGTILGLGGLPSRSSYNIEEVDSKYLE